MFDTEQSAYRGLRDIIGIGTDQVIMFCGAGLSQSAKIPNLNELRDAVIKEARSQAKSLPPDSKDSKRIEGLADAAAEKEIEVWQSFTHLKSALRDDVYRSTINSAFSSVNGEIPKCYIELWKLKIRGIITTNLDRFAGRAFPISHPNSRLVEFRGNENNDYLDVLQGGSCFVANLHGTIDSELSWVFTRDQRDRRWTNKRLMDFLRTCFSTKTIVFVGISNDDLAAVEILKHLKDGGLRLSSHFWISSKDEPLRSWAESAGLRQILYSDSESNDEFSQVVNDLLKFVPKDDVPPPVVPAISERSDFVLPEPSGLAGRNPSEVREILNQGAVNLLQSQKEGASDAYSAFLKKYAQAIYISRWISSSLGENDFFGYTILGKVREGGFGEIYRAKNKEGHQVAIKVLHTHAMGNESMLQGFRRGVKAMDILRKNSVSNIVHYIVRWEIPAAVVMQYIEGANLEEAIAWGYISTLWDKVDVMIQLAKIIHDSHGVPEKVLHRDIKPSNIMISDVNGRWGVLVLDFDLSWHKEAFGHSVLLGGAMHGYIAPELLGASNKGMTRSALVDSFGIGMTLFFLLSGRAPRSGEQVHKDWISKSLDQIAKQRCEQWRSLPQRLARLIYWTTQDEQSSRWGIERILGELTRLAGCLNQDVPVTSAELITEELAMHVEEIRGYEWDIKNLKAYLHLTTGFSAEIAAIEATQAIEIKLSWENMGDRKFESVRKYAGPNSEKCASTLKKAGWKVTETRVSSNGCRVVAIKSANQFKDRKAISQEARTLDAAIVQIRLTT
jgi:hypothetical protein